jgi:hypothetical protein
VVQTDLAEKKRKEKRKKNLLLSEKNGSRWLRFSCCARHSLITDHLSQNHLLACRTS